MEGKIVKLSFFPEFLELLSFLIILKINPNRWFADNEIDDYVKDHAFIVIGWYKKIRITLSTVASSVNIKTTIKCSPYFEVLATNQWQKMILCLQLARMNLCLRYENVEYGLQILHRPLLNC